jgi:hypothetical protein
LAEGGPAPKPPRRPIGRWIAATFLSLLALQLGPLVWLVATGEVSVEAIAAPEYVIGYTLGVIAVSMLAGCLGLLFGRVRGPAFLLISLSAFLFATLGQIAG